MRRRPILCALFIGAFLAAAAGLALSGFYGASLNSISAAERSGQDAFTAILCLGMAFLCCTRASSDPKGRLVIAGGLCYVAYIYAWFSFGLVWSPLYPLYIALFGVSSFLAILEIRGLMKEGRLATPGPGFPRKVAAIVSIASVVGIGASETMILAGYAARGGAGLNPYDAYIVLDLGIVFPAIVMFALLSLRRKENGALLQTLGLAKIAMVLPGLVAGDIANYLLKGAFKDPYFCAAAALLSAFVAALLIKALRSLEPAMTRTTS